MMLGCCPYLSRISTSSVGSLFALLMICNTDKRVLTNIKAGNRHSHTADTMHFYLHCVLHAGSFVYAAFTDGVRADADVLFDLVGI